MNRVQITKNDLGFKLQKMNQGSKTENELGFKLQKINYGSNYRKLIMVQITENDLQF